MSGQMLLSPHLWVVESVGSEKVNVDGGSTLFCFLMLIKPSLECVGGGRGGGGVCMCVCSCLWIYLYKWTWVLWIISQYVILAILGPSQSLTRHSTGCNSDQHFCNPSIYTWIIINSFFSSRQRQDYLSDNRILCPFLATASDRSQTCGRKWEQLTHCL